MWKSAENVCGLALKKRKKERKPQSSEHGGGIYTVAGYCLERYLQIMAYCFLLSTAVCCSSQPPAAANVRLKFQLLSEEVMMQGAALAPFHTTLTQRRTINTKSKLNKTKV